MTLVRTLTCGPTLVFGSGKSYYLTVALPSLSISSKQPTIVKALGTFLHHAFTTREKVMNQYQC